MTDVVPDALLHQDKQNFMLFINRKDAADSCDSALLLYRAFYVACHSHTYTRTRAGLRCRAPAAFISKQISGVGGFVGVIDNTYIELIS